MSREPKRKIAKKQGISAMKPRSESASSKLSRSQKRKRPVLKYQQTTNIRLEDDGVDAELLRESKIYRLPETPRTTPPSSPPIPERESTEDFLEAIGVWEQIYDGHSGYMTNFQMFESFYMLIVHRQVRGDDLRYREMTEDERVKWLLREDSRVEYGHCEQAKEFPGD